MSRCASAMYVYCLTCTDIVYYVMILFTMIRYCLLWYDIVYYVTILFNMYRYCLLCYDIVYYVTILFIMLRYCLLCYDIVYYVTILFTMLRYCLLCTDIVYYVTVCLSTLLIISLEINITTTSVVGNPQLITLRIFSTHHACVNFQRNRRSHVIVLKHFDKALTTVFIANQITGLRCFCI